jgi:putative flippase GtrA
VSNWRNEAALGSRYALSGLLNTAVGLALIWLFTTLGFVPGVANALGYAIALCLGFVTAKTFVFRAKDGGKARAIRYAGAFLACYAINLLVLYACLALSIGPLVAQTIAVGSYVVCMYLACRLYVFRPH